LVRTVSAIQPSAGYRAIRYLNQVGIVSDARMEEIRRSRGSADYRASTGIMRDVLVKVVNETYEDELQRIQSHVMLLWGGEDQEVPVGVAERALRLIRQADGSAELEVLEGVGHFVPTEAPDAMARVLEEVMAR
jgi:pimeloyl-ACP methyl ester carboxylesterase